MFAQILLQEKRVRSLLEGTDRHDNTPLHVAALNGHAAVVKVSLTLIRVEYTHQE